MEIKLISLHNLYLEGVGRAVKRKVNADDALDFIDNLINTIEASNETREYIVVSLESEVVSSIMRICTSYKAFSQSAPTADTTDFNEKTRNVSYDLIFQRIAEKLLRAQLECQKKHVGINRPQRGNLIQTLVDKNDSYDFIVALIDSKRFIDENDLKYKTGMLEGKENTLKCAKFTIDKESFNINKILLSDTTNKIPEYWYYDFLDLQETRSDIKNTKCAYDSLSGIIDQSLKTKFKPDCQEIKNALNVFFVHNECFSIEGCVDYLLNNYEPIDNKWDKNELKNKLLHCNSDNIFDNNFVINDKDIKNKLQNIKYPVNSNIELKIKRPIECLNESIYADESPTGEKVLVLTNVDVNTLKKFNFKNIDLGE